MAIEFVGGNTASKNGATSGTTTIALNSGLTGGIASSVSAGDLVIAVFATGTQANRTLSITDGTSEYTLIDSELYSNSEIGEFDTSLRVAYKFMGGTPDTATTFGPTGSGQDAGTMAVYVFRGVDSTTPLDVAAVSATGIDTGIPNPPGITPTTAGAFGVFVGAAGHDGGIDTFTSSDLTDFRTIGHNDTIDSTLGIGHIDNWTSGEINPAAFGFTQTDAATYSWAAMSIALRPAGGDTTDDLLANDVSSASSVGTPVIGQTHVILANDVASASSVGTPVLGQVHALLANDVASASSVGTPAIALVTPLLADDVASASSVSAPVIGQVHALTANNVASASSVSAPALADVGGSEPDRGDAGPIVSRRRRIRPEEIIAIVEAVKAAEQEAAPKPTAKKRKALARKIVETIDEDNIFTQALKKPVAQFVRQEVAQVYQPGVSWDEVYTAVTRIIGAAQAEARRIEQEIEDEDEFLILMAA